VKIRIGFYLFRWDLLAAAVILISVVAACAIFQVVNP
jgi:hypothetical protein